MKLWEKIEQALPRTKSNTICFSQWMEHIKGLTKDNNHTQVAMEIVLFSGDKNLITLMGAVKTIHDTEGFLPIPDYRDSLRTSALDLIEDEFGARVRDEINKRL